MATPRTMAVTTTAIAAIAAVASTAIASAATVAATTTAAAVAGVGWGRCAVQECDTDDRKKRQHRQDQSSIHCHDSSIWP
jgi:hypothetical protein